MLQKKVSLLLCLLWALPMLTLASESEPEVKRLVLAVPFQLEKPYTYDWRQERPTVETGYVLVLEVTPFAPKQSAEPVLYVGKQVAERINTGYPSGFVVVIVPTKNHENGQPIGDQLAEAPIWFGAPDLPESIDQKKITAAFESAQAAGRIPFEPAEIANALDTGGQTLELPSKEDLLVVISDYIATYSPEEAALVRRLRLP